MNLSEMQALLHRRLGFRSGFDAELLAEIQIAQEELETEFRGSPPWFLLEEVATASATAEDERLPVPADFLQEYEGGTLWRYDSAAEDEWIELGKGEYDILKAHFLGTGAPEAYSLVGDYFRLHPVPDQAYVMKLLYYKKAAVLTGASDSNVWSVNAPGVLAYRAGKAMAESLKDRATAEKFEQMYAAARGAMISASINRTLTNRELVKRDNT